MTNIDVVALTNLLKKHVSAKMFELLCETRFASEVEGANYAVRAAFAYMVTPYFSYLCTRCGIPSLRIEGELDDWQKLLDSVIALQSLFTTDSSLTMYLQRCTNIMANFIYYVFNVKIGEFRSMPYENAADFLTDIFYYEEKSCPSGHAQRNIHGWLRELYNIDPDRNEDLSVYPSHLNYVPYTDIDTKKDNHYIQVSGLAYSVIKDNIAFPQYGKVTFRVLSDKLFEQLSN